MTFKRPLILLIALISLALPATAAETEFRITVTGMGCSQCVYALEQALQHTAGVKDAIVDIRTRLVVVKVDANNPPSAEALAQSAKNQKYSVAKIAATLVGRVERTTSGLQIIAGSRRFRVSPVDGGIKMVEYVNRTVAVEGVFVRIEGGGHASKSYRFVPVKLIAL